MARSSEVDRGMVGDTAEAGVPVKRIVNLLARQMGLPHDPVIDMTDSCLRCGDPHHDARRARAVPVP